MRRLIRVLPTSPTRSFLFLSAPLYSDQLKQTVAPAERNTALNSHDPIPLRCEDRELWVLGGVVHLCPVHTIRLKHTWPRTLSCFWCTVHTLSWLFWNRRVDHCQQIKSCCIFLHKNMNEWNPDSCSVYLFIIKVLYYVFITYKMYLIIIFIAFKNCNIYNNYMYNIIFLFIL